MIHPSMRPALELSLTDLAGVRGRGGMNSSIVGCGGTGCFFGSVGFGMANRDVSLRLSQVTKGSSKPLAKTFSQSSMRTITRHPQLLQPKHWCAISSIALMSEPYQLTPNRSMPVSTVTCERPACSKTAISLSGWKEIRRHDTYYSKSSRLAFTLVDGLPRERRAMEVLQKYHSRLTIKFPAALQTGSRTSICGKLPLHSSAQNLGFLVVNRQSGDYRVTG